MTDFTVWWGRCRFDRWARFFRLHEVLAGIPGVSLGTAPAKIPASVLPF
ncbi:hypothetical protein HMPREF0580_2156 [Mobiluncus mulieris ATCC 35239]|uniref:Uncharacterized protein n=1 Tax=Mobiluncus mulieris ATCC 35239 TaxID=871571 RepID=E0QTE1_9ACTO|nr:hypothetical protein HMPREF0577_1518 [Mobiluncus mulieris ATCC 35243]EFM45178.1 hypothetical protein HMPREF0580_2156 [Mobiluncus mulieris ATCC 35239]